MNDVTGGAPAMIDATLVEELRAGDPAGWTRREIERVRILEFPEAVPIDFAKAVGFVRNVTVKAEMKREATGFKATVEIGLQSMIGPRRLATDGLVTFVLMQADQPLCKVPAPGFATACQDWRAASWTADIPIEAFEAFDTVAIQSGPVKLRAC